MVDSPSTVNKAATLADQVLHSLVFDVAVSAAEAALEAEAPALKFPILHLIEDQTVKYIAGKIYEALAKGATFAIIDAQTSAEAAAANAAKDSLQSAIQSGEQNAIDKATQDFTSAFAKLVHLDGSARP